MRAILKAQINKTDRNDAREPLGNAPDIAAGRSKWLHSDPAKAGQTVGGCAGLEDAFVALN
jgi:hypothetical protein